VIATVPSKAPRRPGAILRQGSCIQRIDLDRPVDVLQGARALGAKRQGELVAYLLVDAGRQHDRSGLGQTFQPRRHVDRVAEHVLVGDDDVAEMKPDAEGLAAIGGRAGVALDHAALQLDGRAYRLDGTAELDQHAVTHRLDDAAVEALDHRRHQLGEMGTQIDQRALLVGAHQPAVAVDVGDQDGREAPVGGRGLHRPVCQPPAARCAAGRADRRAT
jgi:hypothetical protein